MVKGLQGWGGWGRRGPFPTFKHERDLFSGLCAQQTGQNLVYSDATGSAFTPLPSHILYTVKKVIDSPIPSRDVTYKTLFGRE
jgi:hypothetical protein